MIGLFRIAFLALIALIVTRLLSLFLGSRARRRPVDGGAGRSEPASGATASGAPERLVACPGCELRFPKSEGVPGAGGQLYCGSACAASSTSLVRINMCRTCAWVTTWRSSPPRLASNFTM